MIHSKLMKRLKLEPKITVLYSAGQDSAVLLSFLYDIFGSKVSALHVNARLIEWDDKAANMALSETKNIIDCNVVWAKNKYVCGSKESFCRQERLKIIEDMPGFYVTAHHLTDAVESYLMNCFRGHQKYLPIPIETKVGNSKIFRPFILTKKQDIQRYSSNYNVKYLDDPLNKDSRRGWIRGRLMPVLSEGYPGLEKVVRKIYLEKLSSGV